MEAPKNIGKYQVECELGRGAMGVVYKAHDPVVQRVVAIKTIPLGHEGSELLLRRLQSEARSVGQLEHPNIVTLYDAGEADGLFYMAMQFVRGETLRDRMDRQRWFPPQEIQKLLRQISDALDYAHRHGVVHRDVKPANIMITSDGVVKLTDFGIAKVVGAETTTPGMVMGSPSYMSPEQAMGQPLDGRSDLFSLGSILYELITGERAFPGSNVSTIIYRIVHEPPSPLTALQPGSNPALEAIVLKALAKQPDQRFQTCAELAAAFEIGMEGVSAEGRRSSQAVFSDEGLPAGPSASSIVNAAPPQVAPSPSASAPTQPVATAPGGRGRVWLAGGSAAILFLLAGIFATLHFSRKAAPQPALAVGATATQPAVSVPTKSPAPILKTTAAASAPLNSRPAATVHASSVAAANPKTGIRADAGNRPASTPSDPRMPPVAGAETVAVPSPAKVAAPPSESEPTTAQGYVLKGDLAFQRNQYPDALAAYRKADQTSPNNREIRRKISVVLSLLGRAEEARQYK